MTWSKLLLGGIVHKTLEDVLAAYDQAGEALVARLRQHTTTQRRTWQQLPHACREAVRRLPEFRSCSAFGLWFIGTLGGTGLYIDCHNGEIVTVRGRHHYIDWQPSDRFGFDIRPARSDDILTYARDLRRFDAQAALDRVGPVNASARR